MDDLRTQPTPYTEAPAPETSPRELRRVVLGSSLGTVFEWYDFFLYGAMTPLITAKFFSQFPAWGTMFALLTFAAGFIVRPFGALVFGRIGDRDGRKYTFLLTILIMGASTAAIGMLPTADSIGLAAPALLLMLRLLQGLALGGEYGGAATYVAEYAPAHRRGFWTGFIQVTATGGLFLSLGMIETVRAWFGPEAFGAWAWRLPFLASLVLLAISVWIRLQLDESPLYTNMKAAGQTSRAPLAEAFGQWRNARIALIALFGLAMGQGVVWYAGQFYALFFLQSVLKVDGPTASMLAAWALLLGAPGFVLFGALSDRIGRKPIIMAGCFAAAASYFFIFDTISQRVNPELYAAQTRIPITVRADAATCAFQFNPTGTASFTTPCDVARAALSRASAVYQREEMAPGQLPMVQIGPYPTLLEGTPAQMTARLNETLALAGYPRADNPSILRLRNPFDLDRRAGAVIFLLLLLVVYVTMVYGPIAAALVEMFPTRIRYSGMSLPYHIGNGVFGGLLPATAFAIAAHTGDPLSGLWYPVALALVTLVVGMAFVRETAGRDITRDEAA